ncbi:MAG: GNAT family N-acetyltransferase [archaeon]
MKYSGQDVRDLSMKLASREMTFFGGPPYSGETDRELLNFEKYKQNGFPDRKRTCLGMISVVNDDVVGYQSSTIMQLANPTIYEKINIGLQESLDYVQLKKILVNPEYWGTGVAKNLLEQSFEFALLNKKDWVVDINSENKRMFYFLKKYDISKRFEWKTPKDTLMWRLGFSHQ